MNSDYNFLKSKRVFWVGISALKVLNQLAFVHSIKGKNIPLSVRRS